MRQTSGKGLGVFCRGEPIKRGETIAYYKIRVFQVAEYISSTDFVYIINIKDRRGHDRDDLIGDIDENCDYIAEGEREIIDSNNSSEIPVWGRFVNEPSLNETLNCRLDYNLAGNYGTSAPSNSPTVGQYLVYKIVATREIPQDEEILMYYGPCYGRNYEVNPNE